MSIEYRVQHFSVSGARKDAGGFDITGDVGFLIQDTGHALGGQKESTLSVAITVTELPDNVKTAIKNKATAAITAEYPGATPF